MSKEPVQPSPKKQLNSYVRFSALGIQMALTILIMTWAGSKLDKYVGMKIPVFTLVFALLSATGSMYYFIREVSKK
jgi:hypothetical protein